MCKERSGYVSLMPLKLVSRNLEGGDFSDYLEGKDNSKIALVIADVTGKAMRGAMNASMTDGILRAIAGEQDHSTPASLMTKLQDVLKDRTQSHIYYYADRSC